VIFEALCGTWEDDGNRHSGLVDYCTGISNFVVTRSRKTGRWIAAYVAGKAPNNTAAGGIGIAWAADLHGPWVRYAGNPILSDEQGFAGVARLLRVSVPVLQSGAHALRTVMPFFWLFVQDRDGRLYRQPIDDMTGQVSGSLVELPATMRGYAPIAWDWNGCWSVQGRDWSDIAAFKSIDLYSGGDCATTPGRLVATIKAADLGHKGIAGIALIEKSPEGGLLGGPTMILTPWDSWASMTAPIALQIGISLPVVPPPDVNTPWALSGEQLPAAAPTRTKVPTP